jgi:hypothetical protein
MKILSTIFMFMVLMACGTTDGSLKEQGKTEAYIQGFHDGRHSGMKEEGNHYEHFIKDEARFAGDPDYKSGWLERLKGRLCRTRPCRLVMLPQALTRAHR